MKITQQTSISEVGALVCEALAKEGTEAILTGGAVVTIYTHNEYESYDLDFVILGLRKKVDHAMTALGFMKAPGRHWVHSHSPFIVEFPGSTIAIGEELNIELEELKTPAGILRLLSPTSSCMDRLAAYYHWNDQQGLDQAVAIALKHPIKLETIRAWSQREGASAKFEEFFQRTRKR